MENRTEINEDMIKNVTGGSELHDDGSESLLQIILEKTGLVKSPEEDKPSPEEIRKHPEKCPDLKPKGII